VKHILPENAVISRITMSGVKTMSANQIAVTNDESNNTVKLATYLWSKSGLVSMKMPLKSKWDIEFTYKKDTSFTPSIKFFYVYPAVEKYVEDDLVIAP
jgi:hypothetical protein